MNNTEQLVKITSNKSCYFNGHKMAKVIMSSSIASTCIFWQLCGISFWLLHHYTGGIKQEFSLVFPHKRHLSVFSPWTIFAVSSPADDGSETIVVEAGAANNCIIEFCHSVSPIRWLQQVKKTRLSHLSLNSLIGRIQEKSTQFSMTAAAASGAE